MPFTCRLTQVFVNPQPEFLLEVMKEHQLNPEKTVMVGNDFTTDVAVAQSIGMESILINKNVKLAVFRFITLKLYQQSLHMVLVT